MLDILKTKLNAKKWCCWKSSLISADYIMTHPEVLSSYRLQYVLILAAKSFGMNIIAKACNKIFLFRKMRHCWRHHFDNCNSVTIVYYLVSNLFTAEFKGISQLETQSLCSNRLVRPMFIKQCNVIGWFIRTLWFHFEKHHGL